MRRPPLFVAALCLLTACGNDADYPSLVPIEQLLTEPPGQPAADPVSTQAALDARAAALAARAAALRGPVLDAPSRARLTAARPAAR